MNIGTQNSFSFYCHIVKHVKQSINVQKQGMTKYKSYLYVVIVRSLSFGKSHKQIYIFIY